MPQIVGPVPNEHTVALSQSMEAGKQHYGCTAGALRRGELYRLGNAWGLKFPEGATKDEMIPQFKELEAQGHDILKPPNEIPQRAEHTEESRADLDHLSDPTLYTDREKPKMDVEAIFQALEKLSISDLRKMTKALGLTQTPKDNRVALRAKIRDYIQDQLGENAS